MPKNLYRNGRDTSSIPSHFGGSHASGSRHSRQGPWHPHRYALRDDDSPARDRQPVRWQDHESLAPQDRGMPVAHRPRVHGGQAGFLFHRREYPSGERGFRQRGRVRGGGYMGFRHPTRRWHRPSLRHPYAEGRGTDALSSRHPPPFTGTAVCSRGRYCGHGRGRGAVDSGADGGSPARARQPGDLPEVYALPCRATPHGWRDRGR